MKTFPFLLAAAGFLALSACAPTQGGSASPAPGGPDVSDFVCDASDYQSYVGRNRSTIPAAPEGRIFRVLCSTCAATLDYRSNRVTFTYNDKTDLVTRVSCG